ncbi:MAG: hypothetical protein WD875_07675 [Pirellulales bacterium]
MAKLDRYAVCFNHDHVPSARDDEPLPTKDELANMKSKENRGAAAHSRMKG